MVYIIQFIKLIYPCFTINISITYYSYREKLLISIYSFVYIYL